MRLRVRYTGVLLVPFFCNKRRLSVLAPGAQAAATGALFWVCLLCWYACMLGTVQIGMIIIFGKITLCIRYANLHE